MTKTQYSVRNWSDYNRSLVARGSITYWVSEDLLTTLSNPPATSKRGRPKIYSDYFIESALVLRQLFNLTLRATEGFTNSILDLMHMDIHAPDYTTLSVRSKKLKVCLNHRLTCEPKHILVDSTGVQVIGEGEWKTLKHGSSRHQLWRKLHIAMDADNLDILSMKVTESVRLDGNHMADLIEQIPGDIRQITGDGAYDKQGCYMAAYQRNAIPVFPPQHNACKQRNKYKVDKALLARDQTIDEIGRGAGREERLKSWKIHNNYHRRSLVETTMSRLKSTFGDQMRSRCMKRQQTDLAIRCKILNQFNLLGMPISVAMEEYASSWELL